MRHAVAGGNAQELALAEEKQQRMAQYQVASDMQTRDQLAAREPLLTSRLSGGLWVPGDGIVYAPNVARWFIDDAGVTHLRDRALAVDAPYVTLHSGKRLRAGAIVIACGLNANRLLEENWLRAKKASWRSPIATARCSATSWSSWDTVPAPMRRHLGGV
jgi:glycine/D-amino acid oxidase-like deaminating enzyme